MRLRNVVRLSSLAQLAPRRATTTASTDDGRLLAASSSYSCSSSLRLYSNNWYRGREAGEPAMGWQDVISSIYIE